MFAGREILSLNLMGASEAGKTAPLERMIGDLGAETPLFVLEDDQATANNAPRHPGGQGCRRADQYRAGLPS